MQALKGTGFSPYVADPVELGALAPEGPNASVTENLIQRFLKQDHWLRIN